MPFFCARLKFQIPCLGSDECVERHQSRGVRVNRGGYGNDDKAFEAFRRDKAVRRRQHLAATGKSVAPARCATDAMRAIEEGEQREARELQLRREMFEFVRDTTKLAAGVLGQVHEQQARSRDSQVSGEMRDFFKTAKSEAEDLVNAVKSNYDGDASEQELEPSMTELGIAGLDRFRAEGVEEVAQMHLGQDPMQAAGAVKDAVPIEAPVEIFDPSMVFAEGDLTDQPTAEVDGADDGADDGDEMALDVVEPVTESSMTLTAVSLVDPLEIDGDLDDELGRLDLELEQEASEPHVPERFAALIRDPGLRRKALAALAKAGLLSRDDARAIYIEARDLFGR